MKKRRMNKMEKKRSKWGYIFMLPWMLIFCVFYAYPLLYGITISFTDASLGTIQWIGAQNYIKIFKDYAFWRSIRATICYAAIVIPLQVFIPMWAANTLRPHGNKFSTLMKLLIYLPGVACSAALVISWKFILNTNSGLISMLISALGVKRFSIFDNAVTAIPVLSLLIAFCNFGANLIIYSAALNSIPNTYYEAAQLDGASRGQQFRRITIPMLNPTIVYVFITSTIAALQIFVIPQLITGGGPNYTTSSLLMMVYDKAFTGSQFGYASAIGVILFILTAIVATVQFRITRRETIEY